MRCRSLLPCGAALLVFAAALPAQQPVAWPKTITYVAKLGGTEIGRETVVLDGASWSTEGSFDLLGTRKGGYVAARTALEGVDFDYRITHRLPKEEIAVLSARRGARYTVKIPAKQIDKGIDIDAAQPAFVFDNLVWACFLDVGRELARLERAGELVSEAKLLGVAGSGPKAFEIVHRSTEASGQVVRGSLVPLRISKFVLPPNVEVTATWNQDGLPLRFEIPQQRIVVHIEGLDEIHCGAKVEPKSIVDSGPWREKLSKPEHRVVVERGIAVAMRDGVKLKVDLYRPAGEGKFPAILARTPYNRVSEGALKGHTYAERGYAFIAQDVRGRFESEGEFVPFLNEERDGHDTLSWIAAQPWCTGKIGMIGASYVGLVQWLAAKSGHPALKCIVPQVSPPDPQENFPYEGGCFLLSAAWWSRVLETMEAGTDWANGLDWEALFQTLPLGDLDRALGASEECFLDEWLAHPPHDVAYWERMSYQSRFPSFDLPAFHVSGWWDGDMPGAYQNFAGMRARAKTEAARSGQVLVMGPWTHFFNTQRKLGEVDFGDEAVIDLDSCHLRFFDRHLKGVENGLEQAPPVYVFVMGAKRWRAAQAWPLPETRFTSLYLTSGGNAKKRDGDGLLQLAPPAEDGKAESYRYDPLALPSLEDVDFGDLSGKAVTADQSDEPDLESTLDFLSAPLAAACEIVGPIEVVLWVSSDAADTDFAAALYRVTSDGKRYAIRGGVQRLRYARDPRRDQPVPPNEVVQVRIDLWATGIEIAAGERLALSVDSLAWPGYARNLNTLESPLTAKDAVVATNTIYLDAKRPSHVLLPVIPNAEDRGLELAR
ncbi:MAG: CocE/NonD family hydrolase [Planctomycetes bacterium]|nr:CocE/NonD family hydrolase [Planctomycetota bacterium]